ncbi:MAG: hypothetical protein H7A00_07395 [Hahellaceae bacterium]|nr:hypothetical protein [Hahellaceae bacterium]
MTGRQTSRLILALCLASATAYAAEATEWNLRNDEDGVQVFTRDDPDNAHLQYRGIGIAKTSPAKVADMMHDVKGMSQWLYNSYDFELLEEYGPDSRLLRMKVRTPMVVQERDLVLTQTFEKISDLEVIVHLEGKPDAVEIDPDYVRIPYFKGTWHLLQDAASGVTTIELMGQVDPGGAIPTFVSNAMLTETPWQNVRAVRALSETGENPYW